MRRHQLPFLAMMGFFSVAPILCAQPAPAGEPAAPVSTVGKISAYLVVGDVELTPKGGVPHKLVRGEQFEEGSFLRANWDGSALLVLSNGSVLKITGNTQLMITAYRQDAYDEKIEGTFLRLNRDPSKSRTQLDLRNGTLQGEVKQLNTAKGSRFYVDTPGGTAAVRGTILSISVIRDAAGRVMQILATCMVGNVAFTPIGIVTVTNAAGQKVTTATNGNPDVDVRTGGQMQLNLKVDPVSGSIVGGGVTGASLGANATNNLIQALNDTVNAARQLTGQPIAPPQSISPTESSSPVFMVNGLPVPLEPHEYTIIPPDPPTPPIIWDPPTYFPPDNSTGIQSIGTNPSNLSVD